MRLEEFAIIISFRFFELIIRRGLDENNEERLPTHPNGRTQNIDNSKFIIKLQRIQQHQSENSRYLPFYRRYSPSINLH